MADVVLLGSLSDREFWYDPEKHDVLVRIPSVREYIRAAPGWKVLSGDYSQIEVKIMAYLSQDPWLISAINSRKDIHAFMCCEINAFEYDFFIDVLKKKYKHPNCRNFTDAAIAALHHQYTAKRGETKAVTFGVPYGAGIAKIAATIRNKFYQFPDGTIGLEPLEIAKRRAQELMENYFSKAQRLKRWLNLQKKLAVDLGRTFDIIGRSRWYNVPEEDDPERNEKLAKIGRDAGNQPIQSSNATILKMAVARLYKALRGGRLNGPNLYGGARIQLVVHDEIVMTAPEEHAEEVSCIMKACMEDAYNSITKEIDGQICRLADIWNEVDIVVNDYWSKE